MRVRCVCSAVPVLVLISCVAVLARAEAPNESRPAGRITLERVEAFEKRAATLDMLGRTEQASGIRRMIAGWEKRCPFQPRMRDQFSDHYAAGRPVVERTKPSSMICSSAWTDDVLIYQGDYALNPWLYGNSFAADYDSVSNLFCASGLPDSTIRIFHSTDLGKTWNDMLTVTPSPAEPSYQLDLCVSDDGDSTFLYLFYLHSGDGGNLWCTVVDYTSWTPLRSATLDSAVADSVVQFWATRDHYFGDGYFVHVVYQKGGGEGATYYTSSFDHGGSWEVPVLLGDEMSSPCIAYGGYSGEGILHVGAIARQSIDTSSACYMRSVDYGTSWWMDWMPLHQGWFSGRDGLDIVLAAEHSMDTVSQLVQAVITTVDSLGRADLYNRFDLSGGFGGWGTSPPISHISQYNEHLPSIEVYRSEGNHAFWCAYYMDDTVTGNWDSIMVVSTDSALWSGPGTAINDSLYATNIRPQLLYADGFPGVAYGGVGGVNLYYDNLWTTGAEETRRWDLEGLSLRLFQSSPNPFRSKTSISYVLPIRGRVSLKIYNAAGQVVRTLYDAVQIAGIHSVVWDGVDRFGEPVPAGVYIYRLTTPSITLSKKLVFLR